MAGLTLSEFTYAPDQVLAFHAHERAYLSLVLEGSYTETADRFTNRYGACNVILHPAGETHSDHFHAQGGHIFNVEIGPVALERILPHTSLLSQRIELRAETPLRLMQHLYQEYRQCDAVSPLAVEGLTLELIATLARQAMPRTEDRSPRWLAEARDLLHSRYQEPVTLSEISAELGVHPTHLARLFRRHYHCTVGEYVRRLRVLYACQQLADTEVALGEIAQVAGFADQSHFSRTFKRLIGVSPATYRCTTRAR